MQHDVKIDEDGDVWVKLDSPYVPPGVEYWFNKTKADRDYEELFSRPIEISPEPRSSAGWASGYFGPAEYLGWHVDRRNTFGQGERIWPYGKRAR